MGDYLDPREGEGTLGLGHNPLSVEAESESGPFPSVQRLEEPFERQLYVGGRGEHAGPDVGWKCEGRELQSCLLAWRDDFTRDGDDLVEAVDQKCFPRKAQCPLTGPHELSTDDPLKAKRKAERQNQLHHG